VTFGWPSGRYEHWPGSRAQGQTGRAARLFGASETLDPGAVYTLWAPYTLDYKRDLAAVRAQLDQEDVAAAWAEGQAMTLEEAVAHALETPPPTS